MENNLEPTEEHEDDEQTAEFELEPKIIEIEVPNTAAIFYYEGGLKAGLEALINTKHIQELSNMSDDAAIVRDAIHALSKFLEVIQQVKLDVIQEHQDIREAKAAGIQASIMPNKLEEDDDD